MSPEEKRELEEYKKKVDKLESILFGINNDPRFQAKVRGQVVGLTATNAKPYLILKNGDRYEITTTVKLN